MIYQKNPQTLSELRFLRAENESETMYADATW